MKEHYHTLFQSFLERSVGLTLKRLNPDPDIALSAQEKDRVLNALDDALTAEIAWPETWPLLNQAAPKMEMAGMRDEWVPFLERGIGLAAKKDDQVAEARLAIDLGDMYRHMNQLEQSDAFFRKSLKISEKNSWSTQQGIALNRLAMLALRKSLYVEAEQLSKSALDILPNAHVDRANSYYVQGTSKYEVGNPDDAIPLLMKSCEIWRESGSKRKYAWGLRNLGPALRISGQLDEAFTCYEKASLLLQEIGDLRNLAIVQMNLGIIKSKLKKYAEAVNLYKEGMLIFQDLSDYLNLARAYGNIGIEHRKIGKYSESERSLVHSIQFALQAQREQTICNFMFELLVTHYHSHCQEKTQISLDKLVYRLNDLKENPNTEALAQKFFSAIEEVMGQPPP